MTTNAFPTPKVRLSRPKSCIAAGCCSTGVSPSSAPSLWVIMQGRRAFLFGSFPTADGRCRTGCCTPPHWLFAVSVFVSTGAATAPRWETIHGELKNDRGSNRPVPDRACGRIAHQSRFDVGAGRGGLTRSGPRAGLRSPFLRRRACCRARAQSLGRRLGGSCHYLRLASTDRRPSSDAVSDLARRNGCDLQPKHGLIVGEAVVFLVIGAFLSYKAYISS